MNLLRDISPFLRELSQLGDKSKKYIRVSKRGVSNFMLFHGYTGDKNPRHLPYWRCRGSLSIKDQRLIRRKEAPHHRRSLPP